MAEAEYQTEGETATSDFAGEATTDATDDASTTDHESPEPLKDGAGRDGIEEIQGRKKKSRRKEKKCGKEKKWIGEGEPLWRVYVKSYLESRQQPEEEDVLEEPKTPVPPLARDIEETLPPENECFPLGGFQLERHLGRLPDGLERRCDRPRLWRCMRTRRSALIFRRKRHPNRITSETWPGVWPCTTRDLAGELRARENDATRGRRRRDDAFPCDPRRDDYEEELRERTLRDLANRKELGHARIPAACPEPRPECVDRASGERPGLVDGDYVVAELQGPEGRDRRVYAYVVLRGLKGMHLPELGPARERRHTWKFCFYQAIVALLAKTQLRYKYAWSANIDYIYDHAWALYAHVGAINVRKRQRLDDVVVYNYKYSVETELVQELRDVPVARDVEPDYEERGLRWRIVLRRKDPLRVRVELGCRKIVSPECEAPVHEDARAIEEWFDRLPGRYRDCVFRTGRFSLAFWRTGLFWYLYNPYRCDEYGLWRDDGGRACVVKFCSRESLRKHLTVLLLRAYADGESAPAMAGTADRAERVLDVQIHRVTFHRCRLHNLRLLERGAPRVRCAVECPSKSPDSEEEKEEQEEEEEEEAEEAAKRQREEEENDFKGPRERVAWLRRYRVTWCRCAPAKRRSTPSARWHHYYVEEAGRLFSLWGGMYIADAACGRGVRAYACYAVCAGMIRITAPEYWSPRILDVIVVCGDRYYARGGGAAAAADRADCAGRFKIGGTVFEARTLPAIHGALYARDADECLWRTLRRVLREHRFAVLTCESACLGVFEYCGSYYACDVCSRGPPLFRHGHSVAYLLRATSYRRFVTALILTIASPERSHFAVNPVAILSVVEADPAYELRRTDGRSRGLGSVFAGRTKRALADPRGKCGARKRRKRRVAARTIVPRRPCGTSDNRGIGSSKVTEPK